MEGLIALFVGVVCAALPFGFAAASVWQVVRIRQLQDTLRALDDRIELLEVQLGDARHAGWVPGAAPLPELTDAALPAEATPSASTSPEDGPALDDAAAAVTDDAPPVTPVAEAAPPPPPADTPIPLRQRRRSPSLPVPSLERIATLIGASIGGLMLLVGLVFALVAVAETGLFGPAARIGGALLTGTAIWVTGAALRGRLVGVPSALAGVGMGTLYGALFAAHGYYGLIGPTLTFACLVAVSGVAGLRATANRDRFMAHLGLFGGVFAPLAISSGSNGAVGLFTYLGLLLCGALAAATWRRWPDLIATGLLGAAALYLGWAATWYGPDSVWIALLGAGGLSLPFAVAAATTRGDAAIDQVTRLVAGVGAAVWMGFALSWVVPIDPLFIDPRSFLVVPQPMGWSRELGLAAVLALPLPLWFVARHRRDLLAAIVAAAGAAALLLAWSFGWAEVAGTADGWMVLGLVAPAALGVLVMSGRRPTGAPLAMLPIATGIALPAFLAASEPLPGPLLFAAIAAVLAVSAVGAAASAGPLLLTGAQLGLTVALWGAGWAVQMHGLSPLWLASGLLLTLGVLPTVALLPTWRRDPLAPFAQLTAVTTGLALCLPVYGAWHELLGTDWIGAVPALLGAHTLLAVLALRRTHRLRLEHPALTAGVALTLAGVTFALPLQIDSAWLTVGLALEGAALAWLATRLPNRLLVPAAGALGVAVGVRLLINPYALAYGDTGGWVLFNWTLYTWGVPTLALIAAAWWAERARAPWLLDRPIAGALRVLAMFTGFALVNVQVSHAFQDAGPVELGGATMLQGMVRSLAWGGWGMALLVLGMGVSSRMTRLIGFGFLLLAAAKVCLYDVWSLPGFVRVGSLVGLGLTLLVSAVLFNWLVLREPAPTPQED